jgi:hypothetical protein
MDEGRNHKPLWTFTFTLIFPATNESWTRENQPMTEREANAEIMIRITEHF